ncbi:MAG: sodium:proton antiporter [Candidatus Kuenenia sp.]|nr:sodium:proton antiporter [Candidatus Kuenenia hertensis]
MSNMMNSWVGYVSLFLFFSAYILIILEELIHLKKAKPILLVSCIIWMLIGVYESMNGGGHAHTFVEHLIAEIGGLFFFLLVAMTYINALSSLNVFQSLRAWLLSKGMSYRKLFWVTGGITFILSPFADNMTSALLMSTVAYTVSGGNKKFIVPAFVNIVVAANAGGAWSPFGDITTLMVWTEGKVETVKFLYLILPSIVNWIIPAVIMSFFVPKEKPQCRKEINALKPGAKMAIFFGAITIAMGVSFHQFLHLPPFMGMMLGMGFLMFVSYYMKRWGNKKFLEQLGLEEDRRSEERAKFDFFKQLEQVEFDTLLFFFGVLAAVGALQYLGYLNGVGNLLYGSLGLTAANTVIGAISAIGDNIPLMYAVLKMNKPMGVDQWLLVTLTTGVGGSMLSIGSAAGVAVMGINRENYTFMSHLKWAPVIILGYAASIFTWWLVTSCVDL